MYVMRSLLFIYSSASNGKSGDVRTASTVSFSRGDCRGRGGENCRKDGSEGVHISVEEPPEEELSCAEVGRRAETDDKAINFRFPSHTGRCYESNRFELSGARTHADSERQKHKPEKERLFGRSPALNVRGNSFLIRGKEEQATNGL